MDEVSERDRGSGRICGGRALRSVTVETQEGAETQRTELNAREMECDRKGERRRVQLVAETERDVRI